MSRRVTLTDPDEIVHAEWDGDGLPAGLDRLPNESATHPYVLVVDGVRHLLRPGYSVGCEVLRVLGGGRE